jgi:hypothetical protein
MKKHFVNIHTDIPIEEARLYKRPLFQQLETEIEGRTIEIPLVATNLDLTELVLKPSRRG